jgi:hypothetical protein
MGATMIGELATSLPDWGMGATMIGELATNLPDCGMGATMIGEDAKATVALVIRTEVTMADLIFNEIEVI